MEKYKPLSIEQRSLIQAQLTLWFKPTCIEIGLGQFISTISRDWNMVVELY